MTIIELLNASYQTIIEQSQQALQNKSSKVLPELLLQPSSEVAINPQEKTPLNASTARPDSSVPYSLSETNIKNSSQNYFSTKSAPLLAFINSTKWFSEIFQSKKNNTIVPIEMLTPEKPPV